MKKILLSNDAMMRALFALYMYTLVKVVLFKFDSVSVIFLWQRLLRNFGNLNYIIDRFRSANFIPLASIAEDIYSFSSHNFANLLGNIVIFIPFGMFLLFLSKHKNLSLGRVLMISSALSLCFECSQLVFTMGCFDVDDILLNTVGGLIGYVAFRHHFKLSVSVFGLSGIGIAWWFVKSIVQGDFNVTKNLTATSLSIFITLVVSLTVVFVATYIKAKKEARVSSDEIVKHPMYSKRKNKAAFSLVMSIALFLSVSYFTSHVEKSLDLLQNRASYAAKLVKDDGKSANESLSTELNVVADLHHSPYNQIDVKEG